jgi:hypothetical protein
MSKAKGSTLSNPASPSSSLGGETPCSSLGGETPCLSLGGETPGETPFVVGGQDPIILENWSLTHKGVVNAWVRELVHLSPPYKSIQDCYDYNTKQGNGFKLYEYNVPLTNIKMLGCHEMGNGWHKIIGWQGLYNNVYVVKFTLATQNKMRYHVQSDTEIINIVEHLRVNSQAHKASVQTAQTVQTAVQQSTAQATAVQQSRAVQHNKPKNHKFVKSEDCILCEWCGSTLDEVRSEKRNNILPGCSGNFI